MPLIRGFTFSGMGAAASAANAANRNSAADRESPREKPRDVNGFTGHMVEGSVQWLLSCVDKEKREKEWLADKYDGKCAEVRALRQELETLRAELKSQQSVQQRPLSRGMAAGVIPKVQGDTAEWSGRLPSALQMHKRSNSLTNIAAAPAAAAPAAPVSPTESAAGGRRLKERRGLNLTVATNSRVPTLPAAGGAPCSVVPSTPLTPPMEAPEEPMSPLLARRRASVQEGVQGAVQAGNEWEAIQKSPLMRCNTTGGIAEHSPGGRAGGILASAGGLNVKAEKIFSMAADDECPASPKRVMNGGKGRSKSRQAAER